MQNDMVIPYHWHGRLFLQLLTPQRDLLSILWTKIEGWGEDQSRGIGDEDDGKGGQGVRKLGG